MLSKRGYWCFVSNIYFRLNPKFGMDEKLHATDLHRYNYLSMSQFRRWLSKSLLINACNSISFVLQGVVLGNCRVFFKAKQVWIQDRFETPAHRAEFELNLSGESLDSCRYSAVLKCRTFCMIKTWKNCVGLENSGVYYARQTREIYEILLLPEMTVD